MAVSLIAIKAHSYGGKFRKAGEVYSAPRGDARVLKALKKAVDAGAATYQTSAITVDPVATGGNRFNSTNVTPDYTRSEPPPPESVVMPDTVVTITDEDTPQPETVSIDPEQAPEEPRPRRRYRRRDMTAEGDDQA